MCLYVSHSKDERKRLLEEVQREEAVPSDQEMNNDDTLGENHGHHRDGHRPQKKRKLRRKRKIGFEAMGKIIGQRWKRIDASRLAEYKRLAARDAKRYKSQYRAYLEKQRNGTLAATAAAAWTSS